MRSAIWFALYFCRVERHDITIFDALMAGVSCLALIGDKAFDAYWLRERT